MTVLTVGKEWGKEWMKEKGLWRRVIGVVVECGGREKRETEVLRRRGK